MVFAWVGGAAGARGIPVPMAGPAAAREVAVARAVEEAVAEVPVALPWAADRQNRSTSSSSLLESGFTLGQRRTGFNRETSLPLPNLLTEIQPTYS